MPANYMTALTALTFAQYAFNSWVNGRQLSCLEHKTIPASLKPYFALLDSKDKDGKPVDAASNFVASQNYLRDKLKFGRLAGLIDLVETAVIYTTAVSALFNKGRPTSGLKGIWDYAGSFDYVTKHGEIVHSLAFVVALAAIGSVTSIPADLYRTFVIEEKHGFNKTTLKTWILDQIKGQALAAGLGLPLIAALLKIIMWAGPSFVSYMMVFFVGLQIVLIPVYPYLIAPIFNKYKPLSDFKDKANYVQVAQRTEALAKRLDFPLGKLWVMDGSTRSSHSNAFFYGLPYLTKHIVLYDTLLDQSSPEEVEAVLAHELGHWKFNHSLRMMGISQIIMLVNLLLLRLSIFNPSLYRSFSFYSERPLIIGLMVSSSLMTPLDTILSFVMNAISRRHEFQADLFAYKLSDASHPYADKLKSALVRLGNENKSVTEVDSLWSAYKHSHPTMPERIARLDELIKTDEKKQ